ncbi:2-dehydro-3-deoxygalactonokinase [Jannaschia sp. CCS1]|uniref:2-dehydro-3-deoxygalactonokinase n=1 Tax=Jannaschia sp. (strain CCS1) TaxID=290400 RepID=UPI000053A7FC|nr:2-dehydro-3-deoxygalactonokinase [Jannaschia sp. CCS1]ABD56750.1 2-keto-3-deoxygalactonate kinase [Jannaschia sp. CCS1]
MSGNTSYADWIAVDWGTTHLRAWAMVGDEVRAEAKSADGMGGLDRDGFEPALLRLIEPWLGQSPMHIVACGMVGARQGWFEAPYTAVPAKPCDLKPVQAPTVDPRLNVQIIPGLKQADPADVMRGEETQIAGFLAAHKSFDGVLCLPGTHAKWVRLSAEEVVSFQTCMTGEMFQLLAEKSVLRHSIAEAGDDPDAFAEAVSDTMSRPEKLSQRLFGLRAQNVLNGQDTTTARAKLSGYLIGAELAATKPYWLGQDVAIAGSPALVAAYADALKTQGVDARIFDAAPLTRAGLAHMHQSLTESA